jgi:hypothetical protein
VPTPGCGWTPPSDSIFYGTDLVLQAQAAGWSCAVVDAYCEHGSSTPASGPLPPAMARRIVASGQTFERKWAARLPLTTSCFEITRPGDVAAAVASLAGPAA